jgi:ferrous iron transport protein B
MTTAIAGRARTGGQGGELVQLGIRTGRHDFLVALAGNPNTGKSTVFNALTGLRQHTGNWPGKTVARAEGVFQHGRKRLRVVDLPPSPEELCSHRDFSRSAARRAVVVLMPRLERNLNLTLQILEITTRWCAST